MIESVPDPGVPSSDEYNIVATFNPESTRLLTAIQHDIKNTFGEAVRLTPPRTLHVTLMEIICDRDYGPASRQALFTDWYEKYDRTVADVIAGTEPFALQLDRLAVSPQAIIIRAGDTGHFNDLRSRLLDRITLPAGTRLPPDITHCTLARFNQTVDIGPIAEAFKEMKSDIAEYITRFELVKDLGPPTFTPKKVSSYNTHTL